MGGRRKIDDTRLLELFRQGLTQTAISKRLGVSVVAVHKRLKKILPNVLEAIPEGGPSLEHLTPRQAQFCRLVAQGKSRTQAVMETYEVKNRATAKAMQNELMQNPEIEQSIKELMDFYGITRSYRVQRLKHHIDSHDEVVGLKALDMSFKLDGYPKSENVSVKQEVIINIDPALVLRLDQAARMACGQKGYLMSRELRRELAEKYDVRIEPLNYWEKEKYLKELEERPEDSDPGTTEAPVSEAKDKESFASTLKDQELRETCPQDQAPDQAPRREDSVLYPLCQDTFS
jgi:DNA-binding CsgD family transcriptional regulator